MKSAALMWLRSAVLSSNRLFASAARSTRAFSTSVQLGDRDDVVVTSSFLSRLEQVLKQEGNDAKLRLSIEPGGCGGFEYKFKLDSKTEKDDRVFSFGEHAMLLVDEISLSFLKGATLGYQETMVSSSFVVEANPNAEQSCSCKASFSPKL
mmetsp:Transcript_23247/g.58922  ORF Transcript_23247/g.58922 Transcript_23247/m.58922 type:complete len:151 (-) Transcript_23247:151-603(-)